MLVRNDCRYFAGEKPCRFRRECDGCPHFAPFGTRLLILKLGASGDVLRTTALLPALKQRYRETHVTWVVEPVSVPLLQHNPYVDRILLPGLDTLTRLLAERYDVLICLDKVDRATGLASRVDADVKLGFGMSPYGTLTVLNPEAEHALHLGISDELKFRQNRKSYQQLMFEALGLEYRGEEYVLRLAEEDVAWAERQRAELGRGRGPLVGVNTGAGTAFAGKAWPAFRIAEFCRRLWGRTGIRTLLLGGPGEQERNREIERLAAGTAVDTGCDHSLGRFMALVNLCDLLVTGDTMGMHVAIALRKKVVALFGSTCAQEIDLYGRGEKIVAAIDCAPCYRKQCPIGEACMETIPAGRVLESVERLLDLKPAEERPARPAGELLRL